MSFKKVTNHTVNDTAVKPKVNRLVTFDTGDCNDFNTRNVTARTIIALQNRTGNTNDAVTNDQLLTLMNAAPGKNNYAGKNM